MINRIKWTTSGESVEFYSTYNNLWSFDPSSYNHSKVVRTSTATPAGVDGFMITSTLYTSAATRFTALLQTRYAASAAVPVWIVYDEWRKNVGRLFNPKRRGVLTITTDTGEYDIDAVPTTLPSRGDYYSGICEYTFEFTHENPLFRSAVASVTEIWKLNNCIAVPHDVPHYINEELNHTTITNAGDAASPLEITITGDFSRPFIKNVTTGKKIALDLTAKSALSVLKIETGLNNKGVTLDGEKINARMLPGSGYFDMETGENVIDVGFEYAATNTTVTVKYYTQYTEV